MATASLRTLSPNTRAYRSTSTCRSWKRARTVTVKHTKSKLQTCSHKNQAFFFFFFSFPHKPECKMQQKHGPSYQYFMLQLSLQEMSNPKQNNLQKVNNKTGTLSGIYPVAQSAEEYRQNTHTPKYRYHSFVSKNLYR